MKLDRKDLIKRCDRIRQTLARYEGAKKKGNVWVKTCVTCGQTVRCDKANGGHFIPRGCLPFRWDEKNVHCQCVSCNLYKNGAYIEYSQWFIKQYGQEVFDRYVETFRKWRAGKIPPFKIDELRKQYDKLLKQGRELEKKVGPLFPKTWTFCGPEFLEVELECKGK